MNGATVQMEEFSDENSLVGKIFRPKNLLGEVMA